MPDVNKSYRGWKTTFFEGGLHIPYVISYPKSVSSGQTYDGRVSNVDIFSTVGALAGATLPTDRKMDGENISPYLTGEQAGEPDRPLFCKSGTYSFLIKNGWKLQVDEWQNKQWLFDLNTEPTEQHNLVATETDKLAELSTLRQDILAEQSDLIWTGALIAPVQIDEHIKEAFTKEDEYIY